MIPISATSTQMQKGKKKRSILGKRKQIKDVRSNQHVESSREVHLDATLALIVDFNALKQITDSRPPHPNAPFFSPLGMWSLD